MNKIEFVLCVFLLLGSRIVQATPPCSYDKAAMLGLDEDGKKVSGTISQSLFGIFLTPFLLAGRAGTEADVASGKAVFVQRGQVQLVGGNVYARD